MTYTAPRLLEPADVVGGFDAGEPSLNDFLIHRALDNNRSGASRTFVTTADGLVVAYYSLAAGGVAHHEVTGRIRRNQPAPIPVVILGRLAVDVNHRGAGVGSHMLSDAIARTVRGAESIGVRALLVHALDGRARDFYLHYGFAPSPTNDLHLYLLLKDVGA